MKKRILCVLFLFTTPLLAQQYANPADVESVDAILKGLYDGISFEPGQRQLGPRAASFC